MKTIKSQTIERVNKQGIVVFYSKDGITLS